MFTVFECRKCGHQLYVAEGNDFPKKLEKIAGKCCPDCGEQSGTLWGLRGRATKFKGKIIVKWE